MRLFARTTAALTLIIIGGPPSAAADWLSRDEVEQSCEAFLADSAGANGALCLAFVQGFLAGVDTPPVSLHQDGTRTSASEDETFTQRAIRTRLGDGRLQDLQSKDPAYCVDEISAIAVIAAVATYLRDHEQAQQLTKPEAVHEALVHNFPCDR